MNSVEAKNNRYKAGNYHPSHSAKFAKDRATNIIPTTNAVEYRNALYKFGVANGIITKDFLLARTRKGISSNIRALISIIKKHGLMDEWMNGVRAVDE